MKKGMKLSLVMLVMILSMLFAAAFSVSAEDYVLYLGDTQVTSENASDIFGDGSASYDATKNTLSLSSANINGYHEFGSGNSAAIYTENALTIDLSGENTIKNSRSGSANCYGIYVEGENELIIGDSDDNLLSIYTASGNTTTAGIYAPSGTVTVSDAHVNIEVGDSTYTAYGIYADTFNVAYDGNIFIVVGNVVSELGAVNAGVYVNTFNAYDSSDFSISCGSVTGSSSAYSYGCYVGQSFFPDSGATFVLCSGAAVADASSGTAGSFGFVCLDEDGAFCGVTYTACFSKKAEAATSDSIGAYFAGTVSVRDFVRLSAEAEDANRTSVGLYVNDISFIAASSNALPKGQLFAGFATSYHEAAVYGFTKSESSSAKGIVILSEVADMTPRNIVTNATATYNASKSTYVNANGTPVKMLRLIAGVDEQPDTYVLYIGGVEVTSENKDDVFGDGTVRYDEYSHRLYLTNANISGSYVFNTEDENKYSAAIYAEQSLDIHVSGINTVTSTAEGSYEDSAIHLNGNIGHTPRYTLSIVGSGKDDVLNVYGADAEKNTYGVHVRRGELFVNNVTVNSESAAADTTYAVYAYTSNESGYVKATNTSNYTLPTCETGIIVINNATVNAKGGDVDRAAGSYGMYGFAVYTFSGAEVTARGGQISSDIGGISSGIGIASGMHLYDESVVNLYGGDITVATDSEVTAEGYTCGLFAFTSSVYVDNSTLNMYAGNVNNFDSGDNVISVGNIIGGYVVVGNGSEVYAESGTTPVQSVGLLIPSLCKMDSDCSVKAVANNPGGSEFAIVAYNDVSMGAVIDGKTGSNLVYDPINKTYVNSLGVPSSNVVLNESSVMDVIYVGGVRITHENASDVFGDGTVSYDPETKTLTLNNANITGVFEVSEGVGAAIFSEVPLTIKVIGTNTVSTCTEGAVADVGVAYMGPEISDSAAITIVGDSKADTLTINTSDCLGVNAAIGTTSGDVELKNVTVNANTGSSNEVTYGILSGMNTSDGNLDDVLVDGAVLNIDIGSVTCEENAMAVGVATGNLDIVNKGELNIIGGAVSAVNGADAYGILVENELNMSGGSKINVELSDVTVSGESPSQSSSVGVYVLGNSVVDGGSEINAASGSVSSTDGSYDVSCGFRSDGTTTLSGGSQINATGSETNGYSAGAYSNEFVITDGSLSGKTDAQNTANAAGISCNTPIEGVHVADVDTDEELEFNENYNCYTTTPSGVVSKNVTAFTVEAYNVFVGGVQVTNLNASDVFGDGKVSYDKDTYTLKLNGVDITGYVDDQADDMVTRYGICSAYDLLNIELVGDNVVRAANTDGTTATALYGVVSFGNLNIYGQDSATLTVYAGSADETVAAIAAGISINVSGDVTVTTYTDDITYSDVFAENYGVYATNVLYINDSASIYAYTGDTLKQSSEINEYTGMSIGIVSWGDLEMNSTGTVYGYTDATDVISGGIVVLGNIVVNDGMVIGETVANESADALSVGIDVFNEPVNVVVTTGPSKDELYKATWYDVGNDYGGVYVYGENNTFGTYTVITPVREGISDLEITETDDGKKLVTVTVNGCDYNIITFASYEASGRMIDVAYTLGVYADVDGKVSVELDLTKANTVKAFVIESIDNLKPMCEHLEITDLTVTDAE